MPDGKYAQITAGYESALFPLPESIAKVKNYVITDTSCDAEP